MRGFASDEAPNEKPLPKEEACNVDIHDLSSSRNHLLPELAPGVVLFHLWTTLVAGASSGRSLHPSG
jgi:hypothetical protein